MTTPAELVLVCLASSRKHGGHCVAGVDLAANAWRRPVSERTDGTLSDMHVMLDTGRKVAPLDVIRIPVVRHAPTSYQPENWTIANDRWRYLRTLDGAEARSLLRSLSIPGPGLFRTTGDRIDKDRFIESPAEASLAVVWPRELTFAVRETFAGHRQVRARFELAGMGYDLAVTDPALETELLAQPVGAVIPAASTSLGSDEVFFTISLGEPFAGYCYKLVAAVIAP
jgi:hypothetical protein